MGASGAGRHLMRARGVRRHLKWAAGVGHVQLRLLRIRYAGVQRSCNRAGVGSVGVGRCGRARSRGAVRCPRPVLRAAAVRRWPAARCGGPVRTLPAVHRIGMVRFVVQAHRDGAGPASQTALTRRTGSTARPGGPAVPEAAPGLAAGCARRRSARWRWRPGGPGAPCAGPRWQSAGSRTTTPPPGRAAPRSWPPMRGRARDGRWCRSWPGWWPHTGSPARARPGPRTLRSSSQRRAWPAGRRAARE